MLAFRETTSSLIKPTTIYMELCWKHMQWTRVIITQHDAAVFVFFPSILEPDCMYSVRQQEVAVYCSRLLLQIVIAFVCFIMFAFRNESKQIFVSFIWGKGRYQNKTFYIEAADSCAVQLQHILHSILNGAIHTLPRYLACSSLIRREEACETPSSLRDSNTVSLWLNSNEVTNKAFKSFN